MAIAAAPSMKYAGIKLLCTAFFSADNLHYAVLGSSLEITAASAAVVTISCFQATNPANSNREISFHRYASTHAMIEPLSIWPCRLTSL